MKKLMKELEIGRSSGEPVDEDDVYKLLGVSQT